MPKSSTSTTPSTSKSAIRFAPDSGASAKIWLAVNVDAKSAPDVSGFVINESYTGAALAIAQSKALQRGDQCIAKVGNLKAMPATVIWHRDEDDFSQIGLRYDE
jgi:hypothetical protein